jgi:translation initiation factor 1
VKGRPRLNNSELVYSTDGGRRVPESSGDRRAGRPAAVATDGVVRVSRQTKGRKGKVVTVVTGAPVGGAALEDLAKELKSLCGAGGTLRGDVIEIQGNHRDRIVAALQGRGGWTVKRAGG